jgi:DNA helicase-2/ATP-dependent DNA helicase PcrA
VTLGGLSTSYASVFGLKGERVKRVREYLEAWHAEAQSLAKPSNLVRNFYQLLSACGVPKWDLGEPTAVARLGALARCSSILVDYESVRRRTRREAAVPGEVKGGQDRGPWYYRGLALHVQNWALGAYEGFEGEDDMGIDAVDVTTVHKAKGLEWPIVFVPCVSANRFPSSRNGSSKDWRIPLTMFDRARYEGSVNDERFRCRRTALLQRGPLTARHFCWSSGQAIQPVCVPSDFPTHLAAELMTPIRSRLRFRNWLHSQGVDSLTGSGLRSAFSLR